MNVFEAWLIYLIIVFVIWLILTIGKPFSVLSQGAKLFIALLVGVIVIFFSMSSIQTECSDDGFWLSLLILFGFITPVILGLWILFTGGWDTIKHTLNSEHIDETWVCEGEDCHQVRSEIIGPHGRTTIIHQ